MSFVRLLEKLLYLCGVINIKENMKFTRTLLIASVAALVFASCGEKKQSNDIITKKPEGQQQHGRSTFDRRRH